MTKAGGEKPGDPRYELLREPYQELVRDLHQFIEEKYVEADRSWEDDGHIPHLLVGLNIARERAKEADFRRKDMPVIEPEDISDLMAYLAAQGIEDICDKREMPAWRLKPIQCQIYTDKSIGKTIERGVEATLAHLAKSPLVVSQEFDIIDGNHRWLTTLMIDPFVYSPLLRVGIPTEQLLRLARTFSDARHPRNL